MARIAGVDIPREKRVIISLTYIHGIGPTSAQRIIEAAKVSPDTRVRDLTEDEVKRYALENGPAYQHPLHGIQNCQHHTKLV